MRPSPAAAADAAPAVNEPGNAGWGGRTRTLLAVLLVTAALLRVVGLGANSLWIDELQSLELSTGRGFADLRIPHDVIVDSPGHPTRLAGAPPVYRVWTSLADDTHPPLYYLALRLWREAFGSTEEAVRSLSVVASLAAMVLLFDLGRVLFNPSVALWACLLMAMAQPQIWYAQEARMYALAGVTLLGGCCSLARIERWGPTLTRWVALFGCVLATALTHYFAISGCLALGAYAVWRLRGRTRVFAVAVLASAAAVYFAAWGPLFLRQLHGYSFNVGSEWLLDRGGPGFLLRWLGRLLVAPARLFVDVPVRLAVPLSVVALLLVLPLFMTRRRPALLLPALIPVAILLAVAAVDLIRGTAALSYNRYYLATAPFVYLSCAAAFAGHHRPIIRHLLPATLVVVALGGLTQAYLIHRPDFRTIGQLAASSARDGDVLVAHSATGTPWYGRIAFLAVDHYAGDLSPRLLLLDRPASPEVLEELRVAPQVFLVCDVPDLELPRLLPGFRVDAGGFAPGVGVFYRLARSGPEARDRP